MSLDIVGLNTDTHENSRWIAQHLKVGDSIHVVVKEISHPSISEIKKSEPEEILNAHKVKYFHSLQKELKEKGLL